MTTLAQSEKLLTVEDYAKRPENGRREELVRGRIVELNVPYQRHGEIIIAVVRFLGRFLDANDIGRLIAGDAAVITERGRTRFGRRCRVHELRNADRKGTPARLHQ